MSDRARLVSLAIFLALPGWDRLANSYQHTNLADRAVNLWPSKWAGQENKDHENPQDD